MSLHKVQTGHGRLAGKVAIVTGAASGFGLATTKLFVSEGCKVVAADLNAESLAKHFSSEATDLAGNTAHNVATVTGNVAQADTWATLVATAKEKFGGLDIVINNAGASYRNKPTEEVTEADFDKCFTVNVKSVYFSVGAVVPALEERGGGAIINIASIGATRPRPGLVWYNASKGAVANATKGLAAEYGSKQIRVNSLLPLLSGTGLFETFVGVPHTPENVKGFLSNVPLGRLTDPSDVAKAALFLGSDDGKFITGVNMEVDGGRGV